MKKLNTGKVTAVCCLTALSFALATPGVSMAAGYPTKPIEIIVPYAAGGGTHLAAETLVPGAEKALGGPIQITTKPGAGGAIGATYVAKAPKDGYTLLYTTLALSIAPSMGKVGYKVDDFIGIGQCSDVASVIAVRADAPFNDAKGMKEWAEKNPGKLTWTHPGVGSSLHIQGANALYKVGISKLAKDIPNKGTAPGIAAVLGGHVVAISSFYPALSENIKAKQLKIIGVVGEKRLEEDPNAPTFKEQGFDALITSWRGLFIHKDTPPEIVKHLEDGFAKIIKSKEFQERNDKLGEPTVYKNGAEFTKLARDQAVIMEKLVKEIGLVAEK